MTRPASPFTALGVFSRRLRFLLAASALLVAPGSPAYAQVPGDTTAEWGFFDYTREFSSGLTNARLGRATGVVWTMVEPVPGSGSYDWRYLDGTVKKAQTAGMSAIFVLKAGNGSAFSDPDCFQRVESAAAAGSLPAGRKLASCPVRPEMEDAWSLMVTALVERYDGDGYRDMVGFNGNLRVDIEVENEAVSQSYWDFGTADRTLAADRYLRLLELSYQAKQAANPDTQVILTGLFQPNLLAHCDENPASGWCTPALLQNVAFTRRILARPDIFDAVDVHVFAYYHFEPTYVDVGLQWVADQMQQQGYQRPLYSLEWTGANMLPVTYEGYTNEFSAYFPYSARFSSVSAFQAMYAALDQPANVVYRQWFEAEQATEYAKLFTNMLALGVRRLVHVQYSDYRPGGLWNSYFWNWQGVIKYVAGVAVRKPSYYTANILSQRVAGFVTARRIGPDSVRLYEFTFPTGDPAYVLWTDGAGAVVDLSASIPREALRVTHLVTGLDAANAPIVTPEHTVSATAVPVDGVPVLLKGLP